MPGSKYEREIRFIGKETLRLAQQIDALEHGAGSGDAEKDAAMIADMKQRIDEYNKRRKEIEDSYIAAGLELPLESRNLNASVYRNGSSFEPVGNDYKLAVMNEARANSAAYVSAGDIESDDIDELMSEITLTSDQINALERSIMEADLADDMGEKVRLDEKAMTLRAHRDDLMQKVKRLKAEQAKKEVPAEPQPITDPNEKRMLDLEKECKSLRSQVNLIRNDMGDIRDKLNMIIDHFNIDE